MLGKPGCRRGWRGLADLQAVDDDEGTGELLGRGELQAAHRHAEEGRGQVPPGRCSRAQPPALQVCTNLISLNSNCTNFFIYKEHISITKRS